jgi:peptidoglycan/xylan/chitin deacetylase (PgdA/CDA1 family)
LLKRPELRETNIEVSVLGVKILLELLGRYDVVATFFTTGKFVKQEPHIVRKIKKLGHEIASHGYSHEPLKNKSYREQEREIEAVTEAIKKIGLKPMGFRAPKCLVDRQMLEIIYKFGYRYDSSLHPTLVPGRYYKFFSPRKWYKVFSDRDFLEIPITVLPILRLPISWLWIRNFGAWYGKMLTSLTRMVDDYAVFYVHPWEFVKLPKILPNYYRRNSGEGFVKIIESYLKFLRGHFKFITMEELYKNITKSTCS